jgi:hypothetical protein
MALLLPSFLAPSKAVRVCPFATTIIIFYVHLFSFLMSSGYALYQPSAFTEVIHPNENSVSERTELHASVQDVPQSPISMMISCFIHTTSKESAAERSDQVLNEPPEPPIDLTAETEHESREEAFNSCQTPPRVAQGW